MSRGVPPRSKQSCNRSLAPHRQILRTIVLLGAIIVPPRVVLMVEAQQNSGNSNNNATTQVCRFALIAPFVVPKDDDRPNQNYAALGASYAAAMQLALEHLQNPTAEASRAIVPDLADRMEGCLIGTDESDGSTPLLQFDTTPVLRNSEDEDTISFATLVEAEQTYKGTLCGIVGPFDGKGVEKTLVYSDVVGLTQFLVTGGDADDFAGGDGRTAFANFFILQDYALRFAEFVHNELQLDYLTVITTNSKKNRLLHDILPSALEQAGFESDNYHLLKFEDEKHKSEDGTKFDLTKARDTGIRNIFLATDERNSAETLPSIAQWLDDLNMLNGEYQYFLWEDSVRPDDFEFVFQGHLNSMDDPLVKLFHGMGFFSEIDPYVLHTEKDPFLRAWRSFDSSTLESALPESVQPSDPSFYSTALPYRHSSFVYDSAIAMGLAKCAELRNTQQQPPKDDEAPEPNHDERHLQQNDGKAGDGNGDKEGGGDEKGGDGSGKKPKRPKPPASEHVKQILDMEPFQGASGPVDFVSTANDERIRVVDGITQAMLNFRAIEKDDGSVAFETPIVGVWSQGQWETTDQFLFSTSTNQPPNPQFVVDEQNFLSDWVAGLGFALFAIGFALALACSAAIAYMREDKQIRVAQPVFLQLICLGALVENFSILTLSFDESRGWSKNSLSAACMATPWLFFIGHSMIYSAIFCKLWRVDRVMSMTRRKVTSLQVIWPLAIVLVAVVLLLILWTALDPWKWEREFVTYLPPETFGKCQSDHFGAFFWPLTGILMICTFLTMLVVWKTKDVSQDLSDTSTVFYLIVTQAQAWFVGLPILVVIGDDSVNTVYLGRVLLISLFAMAPLLIVLFPRIYKAVHHLRHPEQSKTKRANVRITGIDIAQLPTGSNVSSFGAMQYTSNRLSNTASGSESKSMSSTGASSGYSSQIRNSETQRISETIQEEDEDAKEKKADNGAADDDSAGVRSTSSDLELGDRVDL